MDEKLKDHLLAIVRTLDDVEVRGKNNMAKILASIQLLESIANGKFGNYVIDDKSES